MIENLRGGSVYIEGVFRGMSNLGYLEEGRGRARCMDLCGRNSGLWRWIRLKLDVGNLDFGAH